MKFPFIKFENIAGSLFFGNAFNFSVPSQKEILFEKNDRLATASDWKAVGKEVEIALDRFEDRNEGCRSRGK